jgi:hypothetical protein
MKDLADKPSLSEEFVCGPARLRIDVFGTTPGNQALVDMNFLNYRLAAVQTTGEVTQSKAGLVWRREGEKSVGYRDGVMTFAGDWASGPLQKAVVTLLSLGLENRGLHPFHASAVRWDGRTIVFLGGESNHGKTMGQVEACRRGAQLISTETTVIDDDGRAVMGSKDVYLKKRAIGTERADKAAPEAGVAKFFGGLPTWEEYDEPSNVDVVIVPAIDGNFDPSLVEMIPFERQFQTLHSLQNYFLLNELLAPGWPMPIVDTEALRRARAAFVEKFTDRPYFFVRAANPQVLLDEVEKVI